MSICDEIMEGKYEMAIMHVNSSSLNLRTEPLIKPSTLIASLPFGHSVEVIGDANKQGWKTVTTQYKGIDLSGVISAAFLRAPLSNAKEALLATAAKQWDRFKRGAGKETESPFDAFVGEMWQSIGFNLSGDDVATPWSAACISFIVRSAGYVRFKHGASHSVYIHDAIKSRDANNAERDFWGYRINEHKPTFGDLVCRKRSSAKITYDFALENANFQSHTDIVVAVSSDFIDAVGGNVSNSVSITRYKLTPSGYLDGEGGRKFAVLRNNN
jgi:hypothetical protein